MSRDEEAWDDIKGVLHLIALVIAYTALIAAVLGAFYAIGWLGEALS